MSITTPGAGRLVPASPLEFSRASKNLSWLLEAPLHVGRDLLAYCCGFGSTHELMAAIPAPNETDKVTGPFEPPRERPHYFNVDSGASNGDSPNHLTPLSLRERKLLLYSERIMYRRDEKDGRLRRRHYSVLDCAFFSTPAIHRKHFAEVKRGILAMEGAESDRERFLECNWPPAFWSYLEGTQLLRFDATEGLSELKSSSAYLDEGEILSIADLFQATAAHRAPAIFLEMAGANSEPLDNPQRYYNDYFDLPEELPSIKNGQEGLFDCDEEEFWASLSEDEVIDTIPEDVLEMDVRTLATSAPKGTNEQVVEKARRWRLHQLRHLCKQYVDAKYVDRYLAKSSEMFWPGSPGNTITEKSELVWEISRNAASLMVYAELAEHDRGNNEDSNFQTWKFKALLTRTAPDEVEDVVGFMAGWLVDPSIGRYVCEQDDLPSSSAYADRMLVDGLNGFLNTYLAFNGHDDLVDFVNSRNTNSVVITEIVLREKYKKQGLTSLAFTGFSSIFDNAPYSDFPDGWLEWANFEIETQDDLFDRESDHYINSPGVFMVPAQASKRRLRKYLMSLSPESDLFEEDLDVFPFHLDASEE